MKLDKIMSLEERRRAIEQVKEIRLENVGKSLLDEEEKVTCENLIGAITLPLGVAGPLKIIREQTKSDFYLPLATTEGALVASVNRGCKAISLSSGARVLVERIGATRGPVFYTGSLLKSQKLSQWLKNNLSLLQKAAQQTSHHLTLEKIGVRKTADYVFVRFYFNTQDAMGMNMVTIGTQKIVEQIKLATGVDCLSLAGNFDIDKKPAWLNFISGRGFRVWAETTIKASTIKTVLKTSAEKIVAVWLGKCLLGSAMSGSLGFNAHYANVVAAFFAATGQDLAHVVEGSQGITTARTVNKGDLYFSIYLPSVMIGTVGGGTKLKTQTEARKIIGVEKSEGLAEVLAGAVLAGELSLIASLAEQSLAKAHLKLGR